MIDLLIERQQVKRRNQMVRGPCCEKMGVKKGPWTPDEDHILKSYIQRYGHDNWRALPKLAGLLRCGKSCRLRWINYLRPDIKRGNFSNEEEETIMKLHDMLGNRWSAIAARLPGRTDNEIKNYWNTHLKKRKKKLMTRNMNTTLEHTSSLMMMKMRRTEVVDGCSDDSASEQPPPSPPDEAERLSPHHHHQVNGGAAADEHNSPVSNKEAAMSSTLFSASSAHQFEASNRATMSDNLQGAAVNQRLQLPYSSNNNGVAASKISNDIFFWYNIFINAEKP